MEWLTIDTGMPQPYRFSFFNKEILKGLTLPKFVFDICVFMLCLIFVSGFDSIDLTGERVYI